MIFHRLALATSLMVACMASAEKTELETMYPQLGLNSLEPLSYEYDVSVDDECDYTFEISFEHNSNFDVGTAETCVGGALAEYDGLPMLAGRWMYEVYPDYVKEATGFDHLSLDYNPCGHPSDGWQSPHYDVHFYMVTPEFRATQVVCDLIPGLPVCDPVNQTTANGDLFFDLDRVTASTEVSRTTEEAPLRNMPEGFDLGPTEGVINMGMHCFDHSLVPATPADWTEPSIIYVSHGGVIAFEPMVPFQFVEGGTDHSASEEFTYVEQTISTLPYMYKADYDSSTGRTTIVFKGNSNVCKDVFETLKNPTSVETPPEQTTPPTEDDPTDSAMTANFLGTMLASLLSTAAFLMF